MGRPSLVVVFMVHKCSVCDNLCIEAVLPRQGSLLSGFGGVGGMLSSRKALLEGCWEDRPLKVLEAVFNVAGLPSADPENAPRPDPA